jgi:hypothetical protein
MSEGGGAADMDTKKEGAETTEKEGGASLKTPSGKNRFEVKKVGACDHCAVIGFLICGGFLLPFRSRECHLEIDCMLLVAIPGLFTVYALNTCCHMAPNLKK